MTNIFLRFLEFILSVILVLVLLFECVGILLIEWAFGKPFYLSAGMFDAIQFVVAIRHLDEGIKSMEVKKPAKIKKLILKKEEPKEIPRYSVEIEED